MYNMHLAAPANLGGALQPRSSARHTPIETFAFFNCLQWVFQLRFLLLFGFGLLPAAQTFAESAVTLAWDANPEVDIANYKLSYGTSPGSYTNVIDAGLNLEATVTDLAQGTIYYFAVSAVNSAGVQSRDSNEISYYVESGTPSPNGWTLMYADSEDLLGYSAAHAFDGDPNTFWHTTWRNNIAAPPPHEIQINLGTSQAFSGFRYLPRQDAWLSGTVGQFEFYVSSDGVNWGSPVATGTFPCTHDLKEVRFAATSGQYIRFRGLTDSTGGPYMSVAELGLIQDSIPPVANHTPIPLPSSLSMSEDSTLDLTLQGTDPDGNTLQFAVVSAPANGILSGAAPNLTYTPSANYHGTDSFTFLVNDGTVNSAPATVSITVAPVAGNGITGWLAGFGVSANIDSDPDHDSITNAVEYVIGGNPLNESDASLLPTISTAGENPNSAILFSYRRSQLAKADPSATIIAEWSESLTGPWTTATGASGEVIVELSNGAGDGIDIVNVYIPRPPSGRLFARLGVDVATPGQ